jgi:hypothetical protein
MSERILESRDADGIYHRRKAPLPDPLAPLTQYQTF